MKVVGDGRIRFFEAEDERPHPPGDGALWQESFVLIAWDVHSEVYAFLRLSQVPNRGIGTAWLNIWAPNGQYKNTQVELPLAPTDRAASSLGVGGGLCRYEYDGKHHWALRDPSAGLSAALVIEDAHPGMCFYPDTHSHFVTQTVSSHIEASGRVTGTIELHGRRFAITGSGWRDHSWGKRDWTGIRAHRFFLAHFPDGLHLACLSYIGEDGHLTKNGLEIRNGEVRYTRDFSIVAHIGEDGISNCGGRVDIRLDGVQRRVDFEPVGKAAISVIDGFPCVNALCRVRIGSRSGVGMSETSNNALGGSKTPFVFPSSVGVMENGFLPSE